MTITASENRIMSVLKPGMVVSMEPMISVLDGQPGVGGYREHDILVVDEDGAENITKFPFGPEYNIIGASPTAPWPPKLGQGTLRSWPQLNHQGGSGAVSDTALLSADYAQ
jgi:hypothetical protein